MTIVIMSNFTTQPGEGPFLHLAASADSLPAPGEPAFRTERSPSQQSGSSPGASANSSNNQRPRQMRASAPRSKRGCVTCKKRHVKCDEARPSCQRCIKWQGFCGGYGSQPAKAEDDPDSDNSQQAAEDTLTMTRPSSTIDMFSNQQDHVYYESWLDLSVGLGGKTFATDTWSRTIPQVSLDQPAVRLASMAIGAMRLAIGSSDPPNTMVRNSNSDEISQSRHYQNALTYYGQSIQLVRVLAQSPQPESCRAAILCCLLFICFETLQGRSSGALGHIFHGLTVMDRLLKMYGGDELGSALDSPVPYMLDDGIIRNFRMLDEQSWYFFLVNPIPCRMGDWLSRRGKISRIPDPPSHFADILDARRWWHVIQYACLEFSRYGATQVLLGAENSEAMVSLNGQEAQERLLSTLEKWHAAYLPIYSAAIQLPPSSDGYQEAIALEVSYLANFVAVRCPDMCDLVEFDQVLTSFREIVLLCAILLETSPNVFTMDSSTTWALLLVFLRCRDVQVRQEASRLLKKFHRRDGLWDSRNCLNVGVKGAEVDEADAGADSRGVVRVNGYKQDLRAGKWNLVETRLRLLDKEVLRDDCWTKGDCVEKRRSRTTRERTFVGVELQPMLSTTGRWLLYDLSHLT